MSTFPATNSNEAVELVIDGGNQLHQIINEDALTEVQTESGPIPSVRKALADTFLFQDPIPWDQGSGETAFNQLRTFDDNIYWAPTATLLTPIPMGVTPIGDSNWKLAPVSTGEWTLEDLLTDLGWDIIGEWSTDPFVTNSTGIISYAGTNQYFRPLSLPYQVNSVVNPDPNVLVGTELVDVSKITNEQDVVDLIKNTSPEVFGNTVVVKGSTGSATAFRQNPDEYTADKATRIYIEPQTDVIDEAEAVGGAIKIFSVPFTDVGPSRYQDFGLYYSSGQNADKGYYGKGVFYLNSKALGVNNPDIACTFQDGVYQAWKATLLPASSEGGNRAVTLFGKRNSTTAHALDNCEIEMNGWVGFDNTNSGMTWWGVNGNFENRVNCFVDSGKNAFQLTLGNKKALKHNGEVFEVCKNDGSVSFSLDLSGTDQGAIFETRVVGRQTSTNLDTLSVAGLNSLVLNYPGATTLIELQDGVPGQCVTLLSGNTNATIAHNANIRLRGGSDYNIPAESAIQLVYSGVHAKWFEVRSS